MKPWVRRKRWEIGGLVLIVLGLIVWMTWHLGYTYIRLVSQPKTSQSQSTPGSTRVGEVQVTLAELDFWTCQVGVFQSEENAKQEKNRLEQSGWETQLISQKPWAVGIGFAHEQGELASLRGILKEGGVATVPKHFILPGQAYRITGSGAEQTAQILPSINGFLRTLPGKRGETLSSLEKEISIPWPQKLDNLQQAAAYVLKAERTLGPDSQRLAALRLWAEYQSTLNSLQK